MNTNSNFEKIIKSNSKQNADGSYMEKRYKATQKRGNSNKRYAGWDNNEKGGF